MVVLTGCKKVRPCDGVDTQAGKEGGIVQIVRGQSYVTKKGKLGLNICIFRFALLSSSCLLVFSHII